MRLRFIHDKEDVYFWFRLGTLFLVLTGQVRCPLRVPHRRESFVMGSQREKPYATAWRKRRSVGDLEWDDLVEAVTRNRLIAIPNRRLPPFTRLL